MRTSLLLSLCLAGQLLAATPVNFKVQTLIDSSNEGPDRPRSFITLGVRKISFRTPPFCRLTSAPDSLTVYLDKPGQSGEFTITNSTLQPTIDFAAQTDAYYQAAGAGLPKEAEAIEFKGSQSSTYSVNDWKSLSFHWSYTILGKPIRRQVAFINLDTEHQICITILSSEESEKPTLGAALGFMKSWYWAEGLNGTYR